jgi:hypothetical protein
MEESTYMAILATSPNLEIQVKTNHTKYSGSILRHQNITFYGPNLNI